MQRLRGLAFFVLITLLPFLAYAAPAQAQDAGVTVVRVYFQNPAQLDRLAALADIWEVDHAAGYAVMALEPAQEQALSKAGYLVRVDPMRTEQARAAAAKLSSTAPAAAQGIPGYSCYRTVEETYGDLATLAANHPALARWEDIGDSWLKSQNPATGYDIRALVLTNQASSAPKADFLLLAAVHARELTTSELATRFAEYLLAGYGRDPEATWLLDHTRIHIIPYGNPDGRKEAERGVLWRKTVAQGDGCLIQNPPAQYSGVDINRNSSFGWNGCESGSCSSAYACAETYRGSAPASEPETQALEAYARAIFADQRGADPLDAASPDATGLFISLHSYSELVLFPWGWTNAATPNVTQLETLGRKFGYFNGYGVCQISRPDCLYKADGTNEDFVYGELGVASYTFELGDYFFESCPAFEAAVLPDNLTALLYAAKAARRPYAAPAGPEISALTVPTMPVAPGTELSVSVTADDARFASNGHGEEPVQAVDAIRYSIDAPSWLTATIAISLSGGQTVTAQVVAMGTDNLDVGRHQLFVEGRDSDGNWGVPTVGFVDISSGERGVTAAASGPLVAPIDTRVAFTVTIVNTGSVVDTYTVDVVDSPWPVTLSAAALELEPGEQRAMSGEMTIPFAQMNGREFGVEMRVFSVLEPWVEASVTTEIVLADRRLFLPVAGR
ncbi:MAG: peptidase M14 [Caldilineaceae bacterium]|nr:peptidase M14 [Caldilineaceae bacterium]